MEWPGGCWRAGPGSHGLDDKQRSQRQVGLEGGGRFWSPREVSVFEDRDPGPEGVPCRRCGTPL